MSSDSNTSNTLWPHCLEKLFIFCKYFYWENLLFKGLYCNCFRLCGLGLVFVACISSLFLLLFFFKPCFTKVKASFSSWAIVCLLQLQSKGFQTLKQNTTFIHERPYVQHSNQNNPRVVAGSSQGSVYSALPLGPRQLWENYIEHGSSWEQLRYLDICAPENPKNFQNSNKSVQLSEKLRSYISKGRQHLTG